MTFASVTAAADQLLFNDNNHFFLRGLTFDVNAEDLPTSGVARGGVHWAIAQWLKSYCPIDFSGNSNGPTPKTIDIHACLKT